jgi:hypothetical protein
MLILVSGEGPTDMGRCAGTEPVTGAAFEAGPMAWLVDQIAETSEGYPFIDSEFMFGVSKQSLSEKSKKLKPPSLPGRKRGQETAYYFRNARALALEAINLAATFDQSVVAVLFRDADGTQSAGRGQWRDKWNSMCQGFGYEGYAAGVPMLPNPKSEAWLLCALKPNQPYQHCTQIEDESGNDAGLDALKSQLERALGEPPTATLLAELVREGRVDAARIEMASFVRFRERLKSVLRDPSGTRAPKGVD